jgi:hypothetical protein
VLEPGEEAEFHQGGRLPVVALQLRHRVVHGQHFIEAMVRDQEVLPQLLLPAAAALEPPPALAVSADGRFVAGGGSNKAGGLAATGLMLVRVFFPF